MKRKLVARAFAIALVVCAALPALADNSWYQFQAFNAGDVVIRDNYTRLVWQRQVAAAAVSPSAATSACQSFSAPGYPSGWRLPSVKELLTLVDEDAHDVFENGTLDTKAISLFAFPNTPSHCFWTSSAAPGGGTDAWAVDFTDGSAEIHHASDTCYARCVQ